MDSQSQVDYGTLIPDEIFLQIFKHSPVEDLKSIRRTCRRFYELCDDSRIQAAERIVLYGEFNNIPALECFSSSSRHIQHIKFSELHLHEAVFPFFEHQGPNIQSVAFNYCTFSDGVVKCIVEQCVNLREFCLEICPKHHFALTVLRDFEGLETDAIIRESVTSFSLTLLSDTLSFSNRNFRRFLIIFPKITELNVSLQKVNPEFLPGFLNVSTVPADLTSDTSFTYSCIYDRLQSLADQLEILRLEIDGPFPLVRSTNNINHIWMKNLKELSLKGAFFLEDISVIPDSVWFQQLTRFNCSIDFEDSLAESETEFMRLLLTHTPLRRLKMSESTIHMDLKLFKLLLKSKLESLQIDEVSGETERLLFLLNSKSSSSTNTVMPNYTLQYLSIDKIHHSWNLLFAFYFRSVKYFQWGDVHRSELPSVCKHLSKLHGLILVGTAERESGNPSNPWLKDVTINFEFEYLVELRIMERHFSLTAFLLSNFKFPQLKSLNIAISFPSKTDKLWPLIRELTNLECLRVSLPRSYINFPEELAGLSKLRHCLIADFSHKEHDIVPFSEYDYIEMFETRPCLRSFIHEHWTGFYDIDLTYTDLYFRDVTTNSVVNLFNDRNWKNYVNSTFYGMTEDDFEEKYEISSVFTQHSPISGRADRDFLYSRDY